MTALDLTYCPDPDCYAPAEVVDICDAESTDGPVRHVVTVCVRRHQYVTAD